MILILFVFFLGFSPLANCLSLEEAYRSALSKNETLGMKISESNASEEKVSQAFGKILPSLSLMGNYTRQDSAPVVISGLGNADQWYAKLNITQPIFHGLSEFAQYRSLNAKARSQKALEKNARLSLYSGTVATYCDLLAAQTDLTTLQALADLTEQRVKDIRERTKIGRSKKGDRLSAEAQAMSLNAQLEGAKAVLRQMEEAFLLYTGIAGPYKLDPPKSLPEYPTASSEALKAIEKRPDVISARELSLSAEESIAVARGSHWPQIDLFGNYYFDRTGTLKDVKWDFGVTATIPLFAGGTIQAAVRENIEAHKSSELALSYTRRSAEKEIKSLLDTYASTLSQYKALKEAADLSEQNYKEQNRDYKYGLVSNLDVLQAMNTLQENKRAMDRTFFQALKTFAQLEVSTGKNPFEKDTP